MNPLAFFPPPARTLSRQGGPPGSSASTSTSTSHHSHSHSNSASSSRPRTPSNSQNLLKHHHLSSLTSSTNSNSTSNTPSASKNASPAGSTINLAGTGPSANPNPNPSTYNPNDPDALPPQIHQHHSSVKREKSSRSTINMNANSSSSNHHRQERSASGSTTPDLSNSISSLNSANTPNALTQKDSSCAANSNSNSTSSSPPADSSSAPSLSTSNSATTVKGSGLASGSSATSSANKLPSGINFDLLRSSEVSQAYILEKNSYPPEDAASLEKLKYRQTNAPHLFLGAYLPQAPPKVAGPLTVGNFSSAPRKLIGYICATAAPALTLRSMSVHCAEEGTPLVCIHSVVVAKEYRHRGVASALLKEFHRRIKNAEESGRNLRPNSSSGGFSPNSTISGTSTPSSSSTSNPNSTSSANITNPIASLLTKNKDRNASKDIARGYEAFALLAHEELTGLYEKAGFKIQGHSHIQYGSGGWLEMRKDIFPKDSKLEEMRKRDLEEERRKDREEGKLKMEESKKEREREREEKRKQSLFLNTNNSSRSNSVGANTSSSIEESEGNRSDPQNHVSSPTSMSPSNNANSSPFPPGITQESILNALRSSSLSASSKAGGGGSNPAQPYTQVLGATLAAKTPAEDSFAALEARLVNGQTGTNLAELYCPMENCGSILLKKGSSQWTLCEAGPLLDPKLNLNLPESKNPRPPSGPSNSATPLPKADSIDKSPRALSSTDNLSGAGPLRGFWSVSSPMSFENVGFSKDLEWIPPWVQSATSIENGGAGEAPSNQPSVNPSFNSGPHSNNDSSENQDFPPPPPSSTSSSNKEKEKGKDADGKPKREKPIRKGTWRERVRERSFTGILSSPESESSKEKEKEKDGGNNNNNNQSDEGGAGYNEPPTLSLPSSKNRDPLLVKFITCGECDCGPLGFTFIPRRLANGGLADQVGKEIDRSNNTSNGAEASRDRPVQQELLVAADRVRYRFLKS